ncbi:GPO family capsid scaffolding protein [Salmonella enterica]|uniref:Phage capsid protein n=2 Tax=Salmonella enterica TaxID=28901 RepID=A0A759VX85_SALER|nr:phage capsid protein [Salmonella enterica subsp. enterica serovar Abony]ECH9311434.1 phage capsid protein [Salmonella enterica subsp. enterica]EDR3091637.1 phage capsid protein [Salmonella enterica subsp. enterica serovar Reading]EIP6729744.1 GPO family capsid scaffolding protein [Salmonella enterica subsp. enterica serovar Hadar]EKQ1970387.1 GPO family capsid scaffolding protein [Salmonella enterica]HCM8947442.1 GPO family capsid scaffolding protein [Salmonella enterica subsp. enterica ser
MPQSNYRTDWLCIATSGQAVDGRPIEAQWLIDAAETYSRKTYTAMIWPHHPQRDIREREFTCNLGEVDALKVETEGDVTKLYAQLIPNQFLIDANNAGQKLFTSAEFISDFGGSGKDYLFGLAVTDIPASLGTEKIKFVVAGEEKEAERGNLETFSLGSLTTRQPEKKELSFWGKLFSPRKDFTPTPEPNTDKPNEGEEKKMDELKALLQQLLELVKNGKSAAEGEAKNVDTPEQAAEEVADIAEEIADAAAEVAELAQDVAENPEDEVKAQEFSVAKASLVKAMKAFNVVPEKRQRRRRRGFSARRQLAGGDNKMDELTTKLTDVMTKLSAMESDGTRRPGNAPAGSNKPFEFV